MSSAAQISVVPSPAPSPDADTGALSRISAAVTPRRPLCPNGMPTAASSARRSRPSRPPRWGAEATALPADHFLEREISWLQFNERVLQMAMDSSLPLLERARFLAIFSSNLDEFFMVRVAGLRRRIATGLAVRSASGLEPRELLEQITSISRDLMRLNAYPSSLTSARRWPRRASRSCTGTADRQRADPAARALPGAGLPRAHPLAVDPAHPFPYISGLSLNLAVVLQNPKTETTHSPASRCRTSSRVPQDRQ